MEAGTKVRQGAVANYNCRCSAELTVGPASECVTSARSMCLWHLPMDRVRDWHGPCNICGRQGWQRCLGCTHTARKPTAVRLDFDQDSGLYAIE